MKTKTLIGGYKSARNSWIQFGPHPAKTAKRLRNITATGCGKIIAMSEQKKYVFHIHGMHCKACEMTIENELREVPYVTKAEASLNTHSIEVVGYFGDMIEREAAEILTKFIEKHGYSLSPEKQVKIINWSDFRMAVPIAFGFLFLFLLLQKLGIVNLVNAGNITYGTAFIIGVIASLSTCMAVVGGLVLSMSATFAHQKNGELAPNILFHAGRIVSFFILGGVIGGLGSVFTLNTSTSFVLSVIVGVVMLIMGINLLDVFHFVKKFQPAMPKFISKHTLGISKINHIATPLVVGVATFFLPCGFTQSMQIYTLSAGSFLRGGLIMFSFALGTLPALALISFSSSSIQNSSKSGIFFKSAGLIVIMFALFNLINSLTVAGLIPPLFNF